MFELPQSSKAPKGTTTSFYKPTRLGQPFKVRIGFAETTPLKRGPYVVAELLDLDLDTATEAVVLERFVPDSWGANQAERVEELNALIGATAEDTFRVEIGTVTAVDEDTGAVIFDTTVNPRVGGRLWFSVLSKVNTVPQVLGENGKEWELELDTDDPDHLSALTELMGVAYVEAALAVIQKCSDNGVTGLPSAADVQTAVLQLGEVGQNLDGFLAKQCEWVERRRRDGTLIVPVVSGQAP